MASRYSIPSLLLLGLLQALPCGAASPRFHEAQTRMALSRIPAGLAAALKTHQDTLYAAARGMPGSKPPTVEDVEAQFNEILALAEKGRPMSILVGEMGKLANKIQTLVDPSCQIGISPLRTHFEKFADDMLQYLVLTDEPYWGLTGPTDPKPKLLELAKTRAERFALLDLTFDEHEGKRLVPWDRLSVPFAMVQLSYAAGVHATANMWIMVYRLGGSSFAQP